MSASAISHDPLVTVCLPVYRGAEWIARAIESCLAQTFKEFELLIVDNASPDETAAIARSYDDDRIRVVVNETNVGMLPNHNRAIRLARGTFIKFLHADDVLRRDCLQEMLSVMQKNDRIGLVFSRRKIQLADEASDAARSWQEQYGNLHHRFAGLKEINDGRELLRQWIGGGSHDNWIGEPSVVLVRSSCFARVGGFNANIAQLPDLEMWLRIMSVYDVGFVDKELATYLHHDNSATAQAIRTNSHWLDRLYVLESLLRFPQNRRDYPELRVMRRAELRSVLKALARENAHRRRRAGEFLRYVGARRKGHAQVG